MAIRIKPTINPGHEATGDLSQAIHAAGVIRHIFSASTCAAMRGNADLFTRGTQTYQAVDKQELDER